MRYASVFVTVLIVWIAIIFIAALADDSDTTYDLYKITMVFTIGMFLFGFWRRR